MSISRRYFIASSAAFPGLAQPPPTPLKIVVAGGHPGDPECGCAGSIARFTGTGHQVVLLYLNRGDGYCGAAPRNNCASIRTAEAQEACRILKARAAFGGQIDGQSVIDAQRYTAFDRVLSAEKPDVVFTTPGRPAEPERPSTSTSTPAPGMITSEPAAVPRPVTTTASDQATIGKSLVIKGEVSGSESLYIDGRVEGSINLSDRKSTRLHSSHLSM